MHESFKDSTNFHVILKSPCVFVNSTYYTNNSFVYIYHDVIIHILQTL